MKDNEKSGLAESDPRIRQSRLIKASEAEMGEIAVAQRGAG